MQAVLVPAVGRLVEDHYREIALAPEIAEVLEDMIGDIFDQVEDRSVGDAPRPDDMRGSLVRVSQLWWTTSR